MALSQRTRRILEIALADKEAAREIADFFNESNQDLKDITAKLDSDTGVSDTNYSDITEDNP